MSAVLATTTRFGTLSTILVCHVQLFQVLIESIGKQNLATTALSSLHLHDHLPSLHFDLMFFHLLAAFLHLVDLLFVASFFCFSFFPLFVGDSSHNLHRFFGFFLLFINVSFLMRFNLLLVSISLLLDQTLLQPPFECLIAFLLLDLFLKPLVFLLTKLMLFLKRLSDKFALFPLVHFVGPVLVFSIQSCLLDDHLFEEVLLCLEHEYLSESLLMFHESEPGVMVNLVFGNLVFLPSVHVKHGFVNAAELRLFVVIFISEVDLRIVTSAISINIILSSLVQSFQKLFVLDVLAILLVKVALI